MWILEEAFKKALRLFRWDKPKKEKAPPVSAEELQSRIDQYERQIQMNPNDPTAHYNLGATLIEAKQFTRAVRTLKTLIRLNPHHLSGNYKLGQALLETGREEDAIDCFQVAIQKLPDSKALKKMLASAHTNLVVEYGRMKQYDASKKHFEKAIQYIPDFAPAHMALGINFRHQGHYKDALAKFHEALKMDKNLFAEAHYNFGEVYAKLGESKKAIKHYKEAIAVSPKAALAQLGLANTYFKQERYREAAECYRMAWTLSKRLSQEAPFKLGLSLFRMNRFSEAIAPLKEALTIAPDSEQVETHLVQSYLKIAEAHRKRKNLPGEIDALKGAIEFAPELMTAHQQIATAYDKGKDGINTIVHTLIIKQLYINQRDEKGMVATMRKVAGLYKKYKYKPENFVNVKVPVKKRMKPAPKS